MSYLVPAVAASRATFPFKTRTPYANTAGRIGYFSLPADPTAKQNLVRTFAEFQSQIILNPAALLAAPDGYYSWILKTLGTGETIFVAGRILSPQEIGTLHINLDMFTAKGVVLYAGELLKREGTILFNLASGTFVGATLLRQIPLANRRGIKKIEDLPPAYVPTADLSKTFADMRNAGIAAFTSVFAGSGTSIKFASAEYTSAPSFQDTYMGVPLVTPDAVIASGPMFNYYATRFNWTPEAVANAEMDAMAAMAAGGAPLIRGGALRRARSLRSRLRRSVQSRSRGLNGSRVTHRRAQNGRRVR